MGEPPSLPTRAPHKTNGGIAIPARSQWDLIRVRFRKHWMARFSLRVLGVFLVFIIFAEFLTPYSPFYYFENKVYVSPRAVRFFDQDGGFHLRPFMYAYQESIDDETWHRTWREIEQTTHPVRFFVAGFEYRLLGVIPSRIHLFGLADGAPPLFLFGSGKLGRDLFSRTIYATRISLSIALIGVFISLLLGVILGGVSGYYGGAIDSIIQRLSELLLSVPKFPLWLALAAAIPTNWSVLKTYVAIVVIVSLMNWPWLARGIRSKLISLKTEDYVQAARSYGASDSRIIFKYLVPNFLSYIIVNVTLTVPAMILLETSLSFLGVGLRSPAVSWGVLLQQAQNVQAVILHPWLLIPGIFVVVSILALNFVGDGLRDAADPYQS